MVKHSIPRATVKCKNGRYEYTVKGFDSYTAYKGYSQDRAVQVYFAEVAKYRRYMADHPAQKITSKLGSLFSRAVGVTPFPTHYPPCKQTRMSGYPTYHKQTTHHRTHRTVHHKRRRRR